MNKILGYIVSVLGIFILLAGVKPTNEIVKGAVPVLANINDYVIMGIGVIIIVAGILILRNSHGGARRGREVPIYQGKNIVGYRRD